MDKYWEAYEVMSNRDRFERYVRDTIEAIKRSRVKIGDMYLHYPGLTMLK